MRWKREAFKTIKYIYTQLQWPRRLDHCVFGNCVEFPLKLTSFDNFRSLWTSFQADGTERLKACKPNSTSALGANICSTPWEGRPWRLLLVHMYTHNRWEGSSLRRDLSRSGMAPTHVFKDKCTIKANSSTAILSSRWNSSYAPGANAAPGSGLRYAVRWKKDCPP